MASNEKRGQTQDFFYITTTLPYVNAEPHVGFALEAVRADIIARYKRQRGYKVFFNTGTDEHGQKIYKKALEQKRELQEYVDEYADKFKALKEKLNLTYDNFIRTTDSHHIKAAQDFWNVCDKNGFLEKKTYQIKYCVGCELEKTESELVGGKCPEHPNLELEIREEENYFFKFSKFQKPLLDLYQKDPGFVLPTSRLNEIRAFVERGLEDFSISRLKTKMPWGIPVPTDQDHVMYVWFDALVNYISAIGWPENLENFSKWWPVVQYCGKDNLRQQAAMWQAMLMAADLPSSKKIIINGFITSGGQKMSKSLGNVINPLDIVNEYGTDALRYYLAREIATFEDGDFTMEKFKNAYNANLANGIGNLASRVIKMRNMYVKSVELMDIDEIFDRVGVDEQFLSHLENYNIQSAMDYLWGEFKKMDVFIQQREPFKLIKTNPQQASGDIASLVQRLWFLSGLLSIVLPKTANIIMDAIRSNTLLESPLFPRKD